MGVAGLVVNRLWVLLGWCLVVIGLGISVNHAIGSVLKNIRMDLFIGSLAHPLASF